MAGLLAQLGFHAVFFLLWTSLEAGSLLCLTVYGQKPYL